VIRSKKKDVCLGLDLERQPRSMATQSSFLFQSSPRRQPCILAFLLFPFFILLPYGPHLLLNQSIQQTFLSSDSHHYSAFDTPTNGQNKTLYTPKFLDEPSPRTPPSQWPTSRAARPTRSPVSPHSLAPGAHIDPPSDPPFWWRHDDRARPPNADSDPARSIPDVWGWWLASPSGRGRSFSSSPSGRITTPAGLAAASRTACCWRSRYFPTRRWISRPRPCRWISHPRRCRWISHPRRCRWISHPCPCRWHYGPEYVTWWCCRRPRRRVCPRNR
jgi:hypothetical protein